MNTQEFDLNIIPDSAPVIVHVDQYDHGVGRIVASLYDDETPYAPEGASVYVQGTKPDGKFFVRSTGVSISGNVVTADLAEVMTQVAGRTRMQFVVTEPSGRTGTFVFWLDVQLSALPPDSEMSESDISMVEEAIEQMQDLASDAAESAQEAAGFAQNSSDSAEDSEAWAVGTRNGEAVTPGDPTYHNNSKWYAEHGGGAGGGHTIVNSDGQDMPQRNALQFKGMNVTDDEFNDMTIVEGGSGGSTIEVTTAESSLIGENVTVTDGTNTWTAQFDNSGKAVFSGITSTGSLTVSSTDGSETAQYILTAPYFGKYAVTLAFWSATINVSTSTTQLNGKTVNAKKNGVVMGSGVFSNGSASITVPEAGSYTLEVTLSWKTYQSSPINVTSETTYSATLNGFIAPISLSTPTSEFYGQDISVTCDGTAVPGTSFDDSGAASFTALQAGTYVFIVMYNGEPYTATVIVTSETSYSAVINMFTATINVTTPSSSLYGQTITIKKDGTQVGTSQFDNTGAASITVHDTGSYVFEATYDGYTFASSPVNVSAETTYSATITAFTATLNISTSSLALYEQTITIKKGTTTVGTTTFSASGTATFNVHETGEYTLECGGYSSSVTVSAETTYPVTINEIITYHLTVDIYSAASDTLSYTDDNGAQTVTTDSTGKATGVSITITQPSVGVDPTITFTSSIAKDPTDLTADYSKSVTITEQTTEIYVMPEGAVYWYGCNDNTPLGGLMQAYQNSAASNWTWNTNSVGKTSSHGSNFLTTAKQIDFSDISKIHTNVSFSTSGSNKAVVIWTVTQYPSTAADYTRLERLDSTENSYTGIKTLNVTSASSTAKSIMVGCSTDSSNYAGATYYAVWCE